MHRNLHREIRIQRFERRRVVGMIDGIKPDPLFPRRLLQHRRVFGRIDRPESRRERAHTHVPIHLQIENLHSQSVPRLRALDIKRTGQRIVPLRHVERVSGLLQTIAEAVQRVGVEDVAGFQMRHRLRRGKQIFHIGIGSRVVHDVLGRSERGNKKHRKRN